MPSRDPRIDAYIESAADFAGPILRHVRALVHAACPGVEETIKWGMPTFVHAGGILCGMAAFKQHASFGFWRHAQVLGESGQGERAGMGSFGKLRSVRDLPPEAVLRAYVERAARLNEAGAPAATGAARAPKPLPAMPADFAAALAASPAARAVYDAFAPGQRREYLDWVLEAKRDATRARRIVQAVQWLAEGKTRNWKYADC